jgi:hypothetical protein
MQRALRCIMRHNMVLLSRMLSDILDARRPSVPETIYKTADIRNGLCHLRLPVGVIFHLLARVIRVAREVANFLHHRAGLKAVEILE